MYLLKLGELLEDFTYRKSVDNLARSLSLNVTHVWKKTDRGDVLTDISDINEGDLISVRDGEIIPLDGEVVSGASMVNQSVMTGEAIPVEKKAGSQVFAGTAVENGSVTIRVTKGNGETRYENIVRMINESEKLKSNLEKRASHLADTIVMDKTGTLTHAEPHVHSVITFNGQDQTEMLKIAACLEEHFPHSIANAVVREAVDRGISHDEMHTDVQYIVAHGIASTINGQRVVIGSHHFVFEDEGCMVRPEDRDKYDKLDHDYSHLFLCIGGVLSAVINISDPIRKEAYTIVERLHRAGFSNVVMMTGDSRRTAEKVADELHLDKFYGEVLPEDKAGFVARERTAGHRVVMVGDGINDSPALAEADVGIAISEGAEIASQAADITISGESLESIITIRRISEELMKRIHKNYHDIIGFNLTLILLGVLGIIPPAASAVLHNSSTVLFTLADMTDLPEIS